MSPARRRWMQQFRPTAPIRASHTRNRTASSAPLKHRQTIHSFANQYGMTKIQAPTAWGLTTGSAAVKIAMLDCGIYEAHPDLAGKVLARQDFTGSASTARTICAITARMSRGSPARIRTTASASRGWDTTPRCSTARYWETMAAETTHGSPPVSSWAADNGANVINMSLGGFGRVFTDPAGRGRLRVGAQCRHRRGGGQRWGE